VDIKNLVKVDIATGEVLEDNLHVFWNIQTRGGDLPEIPRHPTLHLLSKLNTETLIVERVKKFNSTRQNRNKNSWTDIELCQLAVLIAVKKQKFHQAAVQLAKTSGACRQVYRKMKNAGVI